ncbi:hypothetical protein RSAG8_01914, partial [Rhizoctonia solani AG-8 WAC10335]
MVRWLCSPMPSEWQTSRNGWVKGWDPGYGISVLFGSIVLSLPDPLHPLNVRAYVERVTRMVGCRSPEPCMVKPNSLDLKWELRSRDKSTHELELIEYLGSDLHGDMYPLTAAAELAHLSSRDK